MFLFLHFLSFFFFCLETPMHGPFPENTEMITFGMGCFWCSENVFMDLEGVYNTHVG